MALITWQDLVEYGKVGRGPLRFNKTEARKAFEYILANSGKVLESYRNLSKADQLTNMSAVISYYIKDGKFVRGPGPRIPAPDPEFTYKAELAKNKNFAEGFRNYFKTSVKGPRDPELLKIIESDVSLEKKYDRLMSTGQRSTARVSIARFEAARGKLSLKDFAPLTNFKPSTLRYNILDGRKKLPENPFTTEHTKIARGKEFLKFFKDNDIKIIQEGKLGNIFFSDPDKAQRAALLEFHNELDQRGIDTAAREIVKKHSRTTNPLYKNTQGNLKTVLINAQKNLNATIKGYSNPGLRRYLEKNPNMLRNASMWFNKADAKFAYTNIKDLKDKGFDFKALRKNLKFELEHNRSLNNYVRKMTDGESVFAKYKLLNDAEFAHNLTLDTRRYNEAKEQAVRWIERNPIELKKISALDKELAELGHRVYAGDQWIGRELKFKPGYRGTVMDAWMTALKKSSGYDLKELVKTGTWDRAMKEVTLDKNSLRQLGNLFGCPTKFAAEGGRIGFQTGGTGLSACVSTKLKQPGALEKIAALPEEVGGALSKLKNAATTFLGMLGRVGTKAAPLAAVAALGAIAEPLVKRFRSDDYSTYLSDPEQQKGMLLSMLEAETPKVDQEILKWKYPGEVGAVAAGAIPGAGELYKQRRALRPQKLPGQPAFIGPMPKGVGKVRAALGISGVLGKALGATFSPLAVAATLPFNVAAQRSAGTDYSDIVADPMTWMGPAFASTGAEMATRGIKNPMLLRALRLGFSPGALRMGSRFLGLPGLALTGGMWAYDKWKGKDSDDEFKVRKYTDDED